MHALLQPIIILLLFVLVRSADLAYGYAVSKAIVRCAAFSIIALLALIYLVIALLAH